MLKHNMTPKHQIKMQHGVQRQRTIITKSKTETVDSFCVSPKYHNGNINSSQQFDQ